MVAAEVLRRVTGTDFGLFFSGELRADPASEMGCCCGEPLELAGAGSSSGGVVETSSGGRETPVSWPLSSLDGFVVGGVTRGDAGLEAEFAGGAGCDVGVWAGGFAFNAEDGGGVVLPASFRP